MSISREEWNWLRDNLEEGMTYTHTGWQGSAVGTIVADAGGRLKVAFNHPNFIPIWDIMVHGEGVYHNMSSFKWADGTPVEFGVPRDAGSSPVVRKVKSLQRRFANKSLPKVKATPLPFPH